MKKLIKGAAHLLGVDIVRYERPEELRPPNATQPPGSAVLLAANLQLDERLGYDLEDEAVAAIEVVRHNTMLAKRRLVTLFSQVAYCERNGLPGAFVECGVWKGGAVGLMALANMQFSAARRPLHLFDAFADICEPDPETDGERALTEARAQAGARDITGKLEPLDGFYDHLGGHGTLDACRDLLESKIKYDPSFIHYHVGWFQDTLPVVTGIDKIAILRLDGDWYASTMVCLEHLYDRVVKGGIVILDDYGAYEGCRKATDEYLARIGIKPYLSPVDSDCRYFIKS